MALYNHAGDVVPFAELKNEEFSIISRSGWDTAQCWLCPIRGCTQLSGHWNESFSLHAEHERIRDIKAHLNQGCHAEILHCPEDLCRRVFRKLQDFHSHASRHSDADILVASCYLCGVMLDLDQICRHLLTTHIRSEVLKCHGAEHGSGKICPCRDTKGPTFDGYYFGEEDRVFLMLRNGIYRIWHDGDPPLVLLEAEHEEIHFGPGLTICKAAFTEQHEENSTIIKAELIEEMKLYSVEVATWEEQQFRPPRDSLEPEHYGMTRDTDEVKYADRMRNTDELVNAPRGMRDTDELVSAPHPMRGTDELADNSGPWLSQRQTTNPITECFSTMLQDPAFRVQLRDPSTRKGRHFKIIELSLKIIRTSISDMDISEIAIQAGGIVSVCSTVQWIPMRKLAAAIRLGAEGRIVEDGPSVMNSASQRLQLIQAPLEEAEKLYESIFKLL